MNQENNVPLCVDLDGTLVHGDLLWESLFLLLRRNPLYFLLAPVWLLRGKATLKAELAKRITFDPEILPYNREFLLWLRQQKERGRAIWLCTASNHLLANRVADHLRIFDGIVASSDTVNVAGATKADLLAEKFGVGRFDYCGNHRVDLAIWKLSKNGIVVCGTEALGRKAAMVTRIAATFPRRRGMTGPALRALRLHQWAKNALLFVPLVAAHRLNDPVAVGRALQAFLTFCLCASAVYLINDMLDLEADRQHARKRTRALACGDLSVPQGLGLVAALLIGSAALATALSGPFTLGLGLYFAVTLAYSLGLKRIVLVDTLTLAALYTVRIIAGALAVDVALSFWLLQFSIFLFFSLALAKRYAEMDEVLHQGGEYAEGRGYHVEDLPLLLGFGAASGYLSVLVLGLYINSPAVESLYRHPYFIWLLCALLLFWISHIWFKTYHKAMHDDPVVFALTDRTSLVVGALAALVVWMAI